MSLKIFERILREECKKDYEDIRSGKRIIRLQKKRDERNSMKDIIKPRIDTADIIESCLRTFGNTMQKASLLYAKKQGAKILNGKFGRIEIDNLWEFHNVVYNFESKLNINLDKGKSRETKNELHDKLKAIEYSFRNEVEIISGILIWTKASGDEAKKIAKSPLKNIDMFGYRDFFNIFGIIITDDMYEEMIRRVWGEEIMGDNGRENLEYYEKK